MRFFPNRQPRSRRTKISAFTLVEMMISVWVYLFIFVGVMIAIQIFALRVYTMAATKLVATTGARKVLNQIRDDIRGAKMLQVGNWTNSTFTAFGGTNLAQGNALQIYETTNLGVPYTIYYLDTTTSTNHLMQFQVTSGGTTNLVNLASYITNMVIFDAEDFQGNILTNSLKNNQVYKLTLQFYQWEYPIAFIGTNPGLNMYDYYQVRTRVCRRALD